MINISLREYVLDVENLITLGKSAYAEQHCKHILKYFPKHIGTYRLLGKACLELDKAAEAGDIFQRVLSVIPDDFVSLVGLGIIREDQLDLDSAIWFMERAYEVDSSNTGINSEIRRLYFKRDGTTPERIRFSSSALIRIQLKSELYHQAISKARMAVAEEPYRIDLQLLLAKANYLAGRKMEAAEICTRIVDDLPFCLEANKILSIICSTINRPVESRIFQGRITQLDPYAAHISKDYPSPALVPADAVTLNRIDVPLDKTELYIPTGEEPAAELIKILSSPLETNKIEINPSSDPSLSIFGTDEFENHLRSSLEERKSPFGIVEETTQDAFKAQSESGVDSAQNILDEEIPNTENLLPEWLSNYSLISRPHTETPMKKEKSDDWIDVFNYRAWDNFSNLESPKNAAGIDKTFEDEYKNAVGWLDSLEKNSAETPKIQFDPEIPETLSEDSMIPGINNQFEIIDENQNPEEASQLHEQLRSILREDQDNMDPSVMNDNENINE